MSDQIVELFKYLLLGLVWLFFIGVLRMVRAEVARPAIRAAPAPASLPDTQTESVPFEMVVLRPESQAGRRYPLSKEITIGRAAGCAVVVDDSFASQLHARCFVDSGQILIEDLGSTNGTNVNGQRILGPTLLSSGDRISIGETELELR